MGERQNLLALQKRADDLRLAMTRIALLAQPPAFKLSEADAHNMVAIAKRAIAEDQAAEKFRVDENGSIGWQIA